jgi:hypothetical protein
MAGVVIGIGLGKSGNDAIEASGAFVGVAGAFALVVSTIDSAIDRRPWRRILRTGDPRADDSRV